MGDYVRHGALPVGCPKCGARPGAFCRSVSGGSVRPHVARRSVAERVQSGLRYYDMDGNPMSAAAWAEMFEGARNQERQLAVTDVGGYRVSTVWLGLDQRWPGGGDGVPLIFETMVFSPNGPPAAAVADLVEVPFRAATRAGALQTHDRVCVAVADALVSALGLGQDPGTSDGDSGASGDVGLGSADVDGTTSFDAATGVTDGVVPG